MSWIDLEGAANMRDLGGLPTTDGRSTRAGVLLRSDDLQELTDQDLLTLLPWRISTVVDLRTSDERRSAGPAPLEGTGIDHVHADLAGRGVDPADAVLDETEPGTRLERRYAGYLRDGSAALAAALSTIAHTPRGHRGDCAAGKDRTGVVCAVALFVVGVEPSAVVEDYVRTGERVSALRRRLLRSPTHAGLLAGRTSASLRPDPRHHVAVPGPPRAEARWPGRPRRPARARSRRRPPAEPPSGPALSRPEPPCGATAGTRSRGKAGWALDDHHVQVAEAVHALDPG